MVTIPADIRRRLDIEADDKLRWDVTDQDELTVAVVRQRYGAFDDFEAAHRDGLETHDLTGYEDDPAFSESS